MKTERRVIAAFIGILCVISVLTLTSNSVPGLAREKLSDKPICQQRDWLKNVRILTQSPRLVHSSKADGDEDYYFKGDTLTFNEFLRKFAAVKLPKRRIAVKNQYGKISHKHFDWVLHIPGQTNSKGGKDREAKEAYPSVTVYAAASGIHFADVVLPEGADVVVLESGVEDHWQVGKGVEIAKKWAPARRKWLGFIGPYLSRIRQEEHNPSIQCVEMRSVLISEYLPKYRIYAVETNRISSPKLFAVSISGEIVDLKSGEFSSREERGPFKNKEFSDFLKKQQIEVSDPNTAIEIGRLIEEITFAPDRWMYLKSNTDNFSIFKMWVFYGPGTYWLRDWEWYAEKEETGWMVSRRYIGPPASIIMPPQWKLILDEEETITEVMH